MGTIRIPASSQEFRHAQGHCNATFSLPPIVEIHLLPAP
jgi:hypothetical protein